MPNYHLITMYQTPPVVIDRSDRNMVLRQADATPKDILPFPVIKASPTPQPDIILRPAPDPAESLPGTYPMTGDVDAGIKYGPNGTDYTGTLVQPSVKDVKKGTLYGANGAEFTGELMGGSGLTSGSLLIDPITGRKYVYIQGQLITDIS